MPLYDFSCGACRTHFHARVPHGERPACPECGDHEGERLVSPIAGTFTVGLPASVARRSHALRRRRAQHRRERPVRRPERGKE